MNKTKYVLIVSLVINVLLVALFVGFNAYVSSEMKKKDEQVVTLLKQNAEYNTRIQNQNTRLKENDLGMLKVQNGLSSNDPADQQAAIDYIGDYKFYFSN